VASAPRPAVFLDRDGTIIEDCDYLGDPAAVRLLPGAAAAIARLNDRGWPVVIVTNQSGIGRGYFTAATFDSVQQRLVDLLMRENASILATYHCPHNPEVEPPCDCRKPSPGLFLRAAREHNLDLAKSVYVGDRIRDLEAGMALGGRGYFVGDHPEAELIRPSSEPARVIDLSAAVDVLLNEGAG